MKCFFDKSRFIMYCGHFAQTLMYQFLKKPQWIFLGMSAFGIGGGLMGMILERYGGFLGCFLCHVERWIVLIGGIFAFLAAVWWPHFLAYCSALSVGAIWTIGAIICFYHAGVQYHIFSEPFFCKVKEGDSLEAFLNQVSNHAPSMPSCSQKTISVFSIPMSLYLGLSLTICLFFWLYALRKKNSI
jgi:disulfide bond formation protein DsbB